MEGNAAPEPETETESEGGSFYLPTDFPTPEGVKAGDTITLRVVGVSEDGEIEVAPGKAEPMGGPRRIGGDDLREAMMEGEM